MAQSHRLIARQLDTARDDAQRQTQALAGLALALFLVVVSLVLVRELHAKSAIEDCLMSGRQNCDLLVSLTH